jgi:hypothetical protein
MKITVGNLKTLIRESRKWSTNLRNDVMQVMLYRSQPEDDIGTLHDEFYSIWDTDRELWEEIMTRDGYTDQERAMLEDYFTSMAYEGGHAFMKGVDKTYAGTPATIGSPRWGKNTSAPEYD